MVVSYFCCKQLLISSQKLLELNVTLETMTENKFDRCCGDVYDFPNNKPRKTNQCCEGTEPKQQGTCVIHRSWLHVFNDRV